MPNPIPPAAAPPVQNGRAAFLALISGLLVFRTVAILSRGRDTAIYLRTLMNGTSDGIYGLDPEGKITFVNRSGAEMRPA